MAVNKKITELTELTANADDDLLVAVDISDTTEAASGTTKKIEASNLIASKVRETTGPTVLSMGAVTDGQYLKRSGANVTSAAAVGGSTGAADNALLRADGTGGVTAQSSAVTVDDNGAVTVPEIAAPSTPASGKVVLYAKSDGLLYSKDDAGLETVVTGGGGGGGSPGGADGDIQYRVDASTFGGGPLVRLDANTIEQRNGVTTQELRVYQSWTSPTNNEGFRVAHSGGGTLVGCFQGSGGGSTNQLKLQGSSISFETGTSAFTPQWEISATELRPSTDNADDIGTDAARVKSIILANEIRFMDGSTNIESPKIDRIDASLEVRTANDAAPTHLFLKDAGRKRVSAQFDKTDTTLANITGLTEDVRAGVTYSFEADLFIDASAIGGFKFAVAGTATATSIIYQIQFIDNTADTFTVNSRQTALGGSDGNAGPTGGYCRIKGTIVVNAAGTLTVQFAQNAANGTSSVLVNSTFRVEKF
jgi:hypothetical protein